jgi:hypothetical protein
VSITIWPINASHTYEDIGISHQETLGYQIVRVGSLVHFRVHGARGVGLDELGFELTVIPITALTHYGSNTLLAEYFLW